MKYNIMKFLLSATLLIINGSNNVYSTEEYEELGLNDFTYDYLSVTKNYQVNGNGALFRTDGSNTIYPTYEGHKLFDLQTIVGTITSNEQELTNPEGGGRRCF